MASWSPGLLTPPPGSHRAASISPRESSSDTRHTLKLLAGIQGEGFIVPKPIGSLGPERPRSSPTV